MGDSYVAPCPPAALNLTAATPHDDLMLLGVEGELDASAMTRWSRLLNGAITEGASGIAVDLRGCPAIDIDCLSVMVEASGKLRARGDGGINLVTIPGSLIEGRIGATAAKELPAYSSAGEALRSLRDLP
jgi:anti-anti-sigma regulatory factor